MRESELRVKLDAASERALGPLKTIRIGGLLSRIEQRATQEIPSDRILGQVEGQGLPSRAGLVLHEAIHLLLKLTSLTGAIVPPLEIAGPPQRPRVMRQGLLLEHPLDFSRFRNAAIARLPSSCRRTRHDGQSSDQQDRTPSPDHLAPHDSAEIAERTLTLW